MPKVVRLEAGYPRRVVCLTEETTETLFRIGAGDRVVGVSGFTHRPPEARSLPHVSTFLDADYEAILDLEPDLVLGFSDLQADLARELTRRGVPVMVFNQRSVAEILQSILVIGGIVGESARAEALAAELAAHLDHHAQAARDLPRRPRVFLEEWPDPLIAGIRWNSELVELCGGEDICADLRGEQGARGRIVHAADIAARDPEVVIASWCGRRVVKRRITEREGWADVRAVKDDQIYEIKSLVFLQPGPAALTDGVDQLAAILTAVAFDDRLPAHEEGGPRRADDPDPARDAAIDLEE